MTVDKYGFYFETFLEKFNFDYLVKRFRIDFSKITDEEKIKNFCKIVNYLSFTEYDVYVFSYELINYYKCSPIDISVAKIEEQSKWESLAEGVR